jgi:DHA1 family tetracycline resistance protein-like MFS transporter
VTATSPRKRRAALVFIFVTVLIDVLAFGVIIPVLPHLVQQFVGGDTAQAAYWVGFFSMSFAAVQFFSSPLQGVLSDRFGRRPVILMSCLGLGLDFVFMAIAPSLAWLFVGRVISAVTSASFTTANAYVADVVPAEQRARSYGLLGAAFGVGFIVGPLIGGVLGDIDLRLPFWFAAVLALLNFSYGLFVLPESLPPEQRSARIDWSHANPIGSLRLLRTYPQIAGLALVVLLFNLARYVYPSVFVLFADYRYGWGQKEVGYVLALVGVLSVTVNIGVVGPAVRRLGERRALLASLGCGVLAFTLYGFADAGWLFLLGMPLGALWEISGPATQAMVTRQVGPSVQGRVQGALMSLVSVAGIIGPAIFAGTFGYFISDDAPARLPGVPFFIAAALVAASAAVAWRVSRPDAPATP